MGCDIYAHAEVNIDNRWEHLKEVEIYRNYELFGILVKGHPRNSEYVEGPYEARGLPRDINPLTKHIILQDADHTFSYLNGIELKAINHLPDPFENYFFIEEAYYSYTISQEIVSSDKFRLVFGFKC
jgi:hypothetical protein